MPRLVCIISMIVIYFNYVNKVNGKDRLDYAAVLISSEIRSKADIVVRSESIKIEFKGDGSYKLYRKYAITILSEKAAADASCLVYYDPFSTVQYMDGYLYDSIGKQITSLKKKEIRDYGNFTDSFEDDNRVKTHHFNYTIYPYTVEYEYEISYKCTFNIDSWYPQLKEGVAVEKSDLELKVPQDFKIKYRAINLPTKPDSTYDGQGYTLHWYISNMPAYKNELGQPERKSLIPHLLIAPVYFKYSSYNGELTSWKTFGNFFYTLFRDRQTLPTPVLSKVEEIKKKYSDNHAIVCELYKYLQENTRYISIQLGIGGFQPFDANYVFKNGYGDCKALSNYMNSLLSAAGIESYPVIINADDETRSLIEDFPSNQFNHVIVCAIPHPKDTVWLECTSDNMPAGYLGAFTSNRKGLMVSKNSTGLINTPKYTKDQNISCRNIKAQLNTDGSLDIEASTTYLYETFDEVCSNYKERNEKEFKDYLNRRFRLSSYEVVNYTYAFPKPDYPMIKETLSIRANAYAQILGKRIFINPNILNRANYFLTSDTTRKYPFRFSHDFTHYDTIAVKLPNDYIFEKNSVEQQLKRSFGTYETSISLKGNMLLFTRKTSFASGVYPIEKYSEIKHFLETMAANDNNKIVLIRKE
jgi:transglutaminase-like putative cysteine protease